MVTDAFFAADGTKEIVGVIDLRHSLNDFLKDLGHCGYSARPSQRGKGYGRRMPSLLLEQARQAGLSQLHISVEQENLASIRVIQANGGVFQRSFTHQGSPAKAYCFRL